MVSPWDYSMYRRRCPCLHKDDRKERECITTLAVVRPACSSWQES
jgi:hypothetical protein